MSTEDELYLTVRDSHDPEDERAALRLLSNERVLTNRSDSGDLLAMAAMNGSVAVVGALLERGARPTKKDRLLIQLVANGAPALDAIVPLLLQHEAVRADERDEDGWTALDWARKQRYSRAKIEWLSGLMSEPAKLARPSSASALARMTARSPAAAKKALLAHRGALAKECAKFIASGIIEDEIQCHDGDLDIAGNCELAEPTLIVGDLRVKGYLDDCFKSDHNVLVVTGSVHCRGYIGGAETFIFGDLVIDGDAFVGSGEDCTLTIGGKLSGKTVYGNGHTVDVRGAIAAGTRFVGLLQGKRKPFPVATRLPKKPATIMSAIRKK